jgi:aldose 1-epimerase
MRRLHLLSTMAGVVTRAAAVGLMVAAVGLVNVTPSNAGTAPRIDKEPFGTTAGGQQVDRYTLTNGRVRVRILTLGGILQTIETPDRHGRLTNVTLGFSTLAPYETNSPYFGALIGRYGNRIANGTFTLDGVTYHLPINNPPNSLHGGDIGFNKKVWAATPIPGRDTVGLRLTLTSPDGDQGYPGHAARAGRVHIGRPRRDPHRLPGDHRQGDHRQPHQPRVLQPRR